MLKSEATLSTSELLCFFYIAEWANEERSWLLDMKKICGRVEGMTCSCVESPGALEIRAGDNSSRSCFQREPQAQLQVREI